MYVNVATLTETRLYERRVALAPTAVGKLVKAGAKLHMQCGAGVASQFPDSAYKDVAFSPNRLELAAAADVLLAVQPPPPDIIAAMKPGSIVISFVYAEHEPELIQALLAEQITCFAMERIPRISRAQVMDALSSQSALAGYYAVQLGATNLARVLPKITSAAGSIGPAKVLVMGLGVAGLEAVATAHRLGAVVEGYDVRPDTAAQVASLGATFVATGVNATGHGGYARELTPAEKTKIDAVLTTHIQQSDLIITTAAIPGRPSPKLISKAQVAGMKTGAVIVDLSAEGGGNCEDTKPGETARVGGVSIVAPLNVPSLLAQDASQLYAKNIAALLDLMLKDNVITLDWNDEILDGTVLTHQGKLSHAKSDSPAYPNNAADQQAAKKAVQPA
jgi:NAD(P) transhydrogenase subunit alpha